MSKPVYKVLFCKGPLPRSYSYDIQNRHNGKWSTLTDLQQQELTIQDAIDHINHINQCAATGRHLPVGFDHIKDKQNGSTSVIPAGKVLKAWIEQGTEDLYADIEVESEMVSTFIDKGLAPGISLTTDIQYWKPVELSVCMDGRRKGSQIVTKINDDQYNKIEAHPILSRFVAGNYTIHPSPSSVENNNNNNTVENSNPISLRSMSSPSSYPIPSHQFGATPPPSDSRVHYVQNPIVTEAERQFGSVMQQMVAPGKQVLNPDAMQQDKPAAAAAAINKEQEEKYFQSQEAAQKFNEIMKPGKILNAQEVEFSKLFAAYNKISSDKYKKAATEAEQKSTMSADLFTGLLFKLLENVGTKISEEESTEAKRMAALGNMNGFATKMIPPMIECSNKLSFRNLISNQNNSLPPNPTDYASQLLSSVFNVPDNHAAVQSTPYVPPSSSYNHPPQPHPSSSGQLMESSAIGARGYAATPPQPSSSIPEWAKLVSPAIRSELIGYSQNNYGVGFVPSNYMTAENVKYAFNNPPASELDESYKRARR